MIDPRYDNSTNLMPDRITLPGIEPLPAEMRAGMAATAAADDLARRHAAKEQDGMVHAMIRTGYRVAGRYRNLKKPKTTLHVQRTRSAQARSAWLREARDAS